MPSTFNLELHFYQQDEVAVFLESSLSGKEEQVSEIHLFVLFALRQMSNLGVHPITDSLAQMLIRARWHIEMLASGFEAGKLRLIRYPGTPGRKRFLVHAKTSPDASATLLDMKPEGFGPLAEGVGYYAPTSVLALLRFLAERRSHSPWHLKCLAEAAAACGAAQSNREISLANQATLALRIMKSIAFQALASPIMENIGFQTFASRIMENVRFEADPLAHAMRAGQNIEIRAIQEFDDLGLEPEKVDRLLLYFAEGEPDLGPIPGPAGQRFLEDLRSLTPEQLDAMRETGRLFRQALASKLAAECENAQPDLMPLTPDEVFRAILDARPVYYVVEGDSGVMLFPDEVNLPSGFAGKGLPIWLQEGSAEQVCRRYSGHRVSSVGCGEAKEFVIRLRHEAGVGWVLADWQPPNEPGWVLGIETYLSMVSQLIHACEVAAEGMVGILAESESLTRNEYLSKLGANPRLLDEVIDVFRRLDKLDDMEQGATAKSSAGRSDTDRHVAAERVTKPGSRQVDKIGDASGCFNTLCLCAVGAAFAIASFCVLRF